MSALSMTTFVREIFNQAPDYRLLTQRIIRDRYMEHLGVDNLDDDQRSLLRGIVQVVVAEMVEKENSVVAKTDEKTKDKPGNRRKQDNQQMKPKVESDKSESDSEEEKVPRKKRKVESSSESEPERPTPPAKKRIRKKIQDASSENDSDYEDEDIVKERLSKENKLVKRKKMLQLHDVESSGGEDTDHGEMKSAKAQKTFSEIKTEKQKSGKQEMKKSRVVNSNKQLSNVSYSDSSSEANSESNKPKSKKAQKTKSVKLNERKVTKMETKVVSRKKKLSDMSEVMPSSEDEKEFQEQKTKPGSDDSDDNESLARNRKKWSMIDEVIDEEYKSAYVDLSTTKASEKEQGKHSAKLHEKSSCTSELSDNSSEDGLALTELKKSSSHVSPKPTADDDESDSSFNTKIVLSKPETKKKSKSRGKDGQEKKKSKDTDQPNKATSRSDDKDENVKKLEKIARACGVLPVGRNYKLAFENCRSNKDRVEKLKQMLRDAGMTGTFSMKSAEMLKLRKEAEELSKNVIMSEGRGRRNTTGLNFSSSASRKSTELSPPASPVRNTFSRLKGIVDSEDSD